MLNLIDIVRFVSNNFTEGIFLNFVLWRDRDTLHNHYGVRSPDSERPDELLAFLVYESLILVHV